MTSLNCRDISKVCLNDQEMIEKVFDGIGISTNLVKRYTARKEERRRIKGGDSQQEIRSREKSEKKNKREKKG